MIFKKLLIANRGEIAVRLVHAAADMGMATVAVHAADEARSLHVRMADETAALQAGGPAVYPMRVVSWSMGEFGPMGLEGGVKLAYRKEMQAFEAPVERQACFDAEVAEAYQQNKALSSVTYLDSTTSSTPRKRGARSPRPCSCSPRARDPQAISAP